MDTHLLKVLKEMIADFQSAPPEAGFARSLRLQAVPRKAVVCIGVRRSGKTTLLFQHIRRLLDQGVPMANIVYLNFFDDRLHSLNRDSIGIVSEAYFSLFPEKKGAEKVWFFFDELQCVPGWESYADRLLRTEKCELFISGSSAQMLSAEIATQMRGRSLSWELFPFSFGEFVRARGMNPDGPPTSKRRLMLAKHFDAYWQAGGFPEVLDAAGGIRVKTHQEYLGAILFRDVIERHDAAHPRAVSDLAAWLIDNTASTYTLNSLTGYLSSLGHKIPKNTVGNLLEWFEDAYFLFTTRIFDASLARSNTNPKKVYCIDHSFVRSVSSGILVNDGHLLENIVFTALRRSGAKVYYYRTKNGRKVDFAIQGKGGVELIQVCDSLASPATRDREIRALNEAMLERGATSATIVTRSEEGMEQTAAGNISILPAWRWLLSRESSCE
jgi:Predicted ATPase (AAA+ superfamily)